MKKAYRLLALALVLMMTVFSFGAVLADEAPAEEDNMYARNADSALEPPVADPPTEKVRIGVSMPIRGEAVWEAYLAGIEKSAEELGNVELIVQSAQNNSNDQLQQIENFISQNVDGIVGAAVDDKAILQAIKKCNDAGIPWVEFGRLVEEGDGAKIDYSVSVEVADMIDDMIMWLIAKAEETGEKIYLIELMGALNDTYAVIQRDALARIAPEYPDQIEIVQQVPGDWDAEKGLSGLQNALQAHPEANAIFAHSEFYNAGIKSALTGAGRYAKVGEEGHMYVLVSGGATESMKQVEEGYWDGVGCFGSYNVGLATTHAVVRLIQKQELEGTNYKPPGFLVTLENFEEMAPLSYGYLTGL